MPVPQVIVLKAEKGEAATTNSANERHLRERERVKKAAATTKRGGEEPPQRKRGREEKEPPPPKRRNGLSISLVVLAPSHCPNEKKTQKEDACQQQR